MPGATRGVVEHLDVGNEIDGRLADAAIEDYPRRVIPIAHYQIVK